jgi:UPF0716 family protein affecting phage T7 exclusion
MHRSSFLFLFCFHAPPLEVALFVVISYWIYILPALRVICIVTGTL